MGSDFYNYGSISLDGYDGEPQVSIYLEGGSGPPNYFTASICSQGSYDDVDNLDGTYTVNMDTVMDDWCSGLGGAPFVLTGTFLDKPGFSYDPSTGRRIGGSSITVSYLGSVWVFE